MHLEKAEVESILCRFKRPEGVSGKDWHVFDDHVFIDENIDYIDDNFFTLKVQPVGEVKILVMG